MTLRILSVLLPLVLAGCATASRIQPKPAEQRICCQSFKDMPYSVLAAGVNQRVVIDDSAQVFRFSDGVGTFKAFELRKDSEATTLEMETTLSSDYMPAATILRPKIIFLNADRQPEQPPQAPGWGPRTVFLRGTVWTSQAKVPATAKYVILYFAPQEGESIIAFSANRNAHDIPVAFTGSMTVSVR